MMSAKTSPARSRNMAAIRSRGNRSTELAVASALRGAGMRGWRRHADLPGRPDFWWRKERVALFVDGCFWHGCPRCALRPRLNTPYWIKKLDANRTRDRRVSAQLRRQGISVVRVWEHALSSEAWLRRLASALSRDRGPGSPWDGRQALLTRDSERAASARGAMM